MFATAVTTLLGLSEALNQSFEPIVVMEQPIATMRLSPDGNLLGVGGMRGLVVIMEVGTWEKKHEFSFSNSRVNEINFNHDGSLVGVASDDHSLYIATVSGQQRHKISRSGPSVSVCFSPDGSKFVAHTGDTILRAFDTASGSVLWEFDTEVTGAWKLRWSPKGDRLFYAQRVVQSAIIVMDPATGRELHRNNGHLGNVNFIEFSQDGEIAIASVARGGNPPALIVMDGRTGETIHNFESAMNSGWLTPDKGLIVGTGADSSLRVFEMGSRQRLFRGNPVLSERFFRAELCVLTKDGKHLLAGTHMGDGYGFYVLDVDTLRD